MKDSASGSRGDALAVTRSYLGALVLGCVGGSIGFALMYWTVVVLRHPSKLTMHLCYYLVHPVTAFLWCGLIVIVWPKAPRFAVPAGYAFTLGLSAWIVLIHGEFGFCLQLLAICGVALAAGLVAQKVARRCFVSQITTDASQEEAPPS